ncbi:hypothetical protein ACJMK2_025801 [Sinanodonta woodiana]|uniref:non-specific serine/threonine protein kinase n=1 Tax=Sinanodonta woodiana TaxID=1069815 RepID=A0ABD3XLC5_SINWO
MKKKRFQLLSNLRKYITNNLCWRIKKKNKRKQKLEDIEAEARLSSQQTSTKLNPDISTQTSARPDLEFRELFSKDIFSLEDDNSLLILLTEGNEMQLPFPVVRRDILPVISLPWIMKTSDIREGNTIEMQIRVPIKTRYEELERAWITSRIFESSMESYPSLLTKMLVVPYVCERYLFNIHIISAALYYKYEQLIRLISLELTNQRSFQRVRRKTLQVIPLLWITKISDIREGNTVEMQIVVPITTRYEELERSWITSRIFERSMESYPSLLIKMQVVPYVCKKSLFYLHLISCIYNYCEYEPITRTGHLEFTNQGSKGYMESADSANSLNNAHTVQVIADIHTIKSQSGSKNRVSKLPCTDTLEVNWSLNDITIKEIHLTSLLVEDADYKKLYKGYYGDTHFVASVYRRIPKKLDMADLGRLQSPNLTELFGILQYNSHRWIIYVEAKFGDLCTLLKKDPQRKVFGEDSAKFVTVRMLLALAYLQTHTVVHGDIRPSKILINDMGMPMLGGLETVTWSSNRTFVRKSPKSMKIGFVAPEVMTGCRPQQASDIFSLGCVAYFIITGRRPFTKRNELLNKMKGPELLDKRISPAGIEFISACLQKSIGRRFQLGPRLKYVRQNQWLEDMDIDREFPGSPLMKAIERLNKDEARVVVKKDLNARH